MTRGARESKNGPGPREEGERKVERGIYSPIVDGAEAENKMRNDAVISIKWAS